MTFDLHHWLETSERTLAEAERLAARLARMAAAPADDLAALRVRILILRTEVAAIRDQREIPRRSLANDPKRSDLLAGTTPWCPPMPESRS